MLPAPTMNVYAIVILVAFVSIFILNRVADALNLESSRQGLPNEFEGVFEDNRLRMSQDYTTTRIRMGIVRSTFDFTLILSFWSLGGFEYLDQVVRIWELGPIPSGLVYLGILGMATAILSMPFAVYSTFVIEERFGFNRTTIKIFILDILKTAILTMLIGGLLLAVLLALFEYAGSQAWVYCWIAGSVFTLLMQYVVPTWIMPLFNKFTPLEEGQLRNAIFAYARSVDFPLDNVFVMDGSKRSNKSNAFFIGIDKHKRVALFDTLIANHNVKELVAILAHEIGHYKKRHILQGMVLGIFHAGIMFYLLSIFVCEQELFAAFYVEQSSVYVGLVLFSLLYVPVNLIISIMVLMLSRRNEYQADRYAAETTKEPEAMIEALKKLSIQNLSNLTPHSLYVSLHYSHPPILERIRAIRVLI